MAKATPPAHSTIPMPLINGLESENLWPKLSKACRWLGDARMNITTAISIILTGPKPLHLFGFPMSFFTVKAENTQ